MIGNTSEYRIDGRVVKVEEYSSALEKIGILMKSKNFLVYQGQVENIAMKNAKERTAMFEEMSRSLELKEDYDKAKQEMHRAEEETQQNYHKKKGIAQERKEARLEKEEADKYQALREELNVKEQQLHLFKLYHNEQEINGTDIELRRKHEQADKESKKREKIENLLKEKKKEIGVYQRDMAKIDEQIKEKAAEEMKKRPVFIKAKEKTTHVYKRLESTKKSLKSTQDSIKRRDEVIRQLETQVNEVEEEKQEFEERLEEESQRVGKNLQLEESQMKEYHRLKDEAGKRATKLTQEMDSIMREQKSDQDRMDNDKRRKSDLALKLQNKVHEEEELRKRIDRLEETIRQTQKTLDEQRTMEQQMASEMEKVNEEMSTIQRDLEEVIDQLGQAKVDKNESSRAAKKKEVIENLTRLFQGVVSFSSTFFDIILLTNVFLAW